MIEIKKIYTEDVIYTSNCDTVKEAVEEAVLKGISLWGADLFKADLRGAELHRANLRGVAFVGADLRDADLRGVDFIGADLHFANLSGADLRDADLRRAYFMDAYLFGANLRGANLEGALWNRVELTADNFAPNCFFPFSKKGGRKRYAIIEPHNGYFVRIIADCFNNRIRLFEAKALDQYGDDESQNYQPQLRELKPKIVEAIAKLKSKNQ